VEKYFLASTELRDPYPARECRIVRRLRSEVQDDLALAEISPPLPRDVYETPEDVNSLIIAARHRGQSLFSISELPLPIYICMLKGQCAPESDTIVSADLSILDWGELRQYP
jgi:hypothetical protein